MIEKAINKAFKNKIDRKWDCTYWLIDIHETILEPNYGGISTVFYPHAKEVLQYLTTREDIKLILWTCSRADHIEVYIRYFKEHGIEFNYISDNPEVPNEYGDYAKKPYCNVLLDDKAGFDPHIDWKIIGRLLGLNLYDSEIQRLCTVAVDKAYQDDFDREVIELIKKQQKEVADPHLDTLCSCV